MLFWFTCLLIKIFDLSILSLEELVQKPSCLDKPYTQTFLLDFDRIVFSTHSEHNTFSNMQKNFLLNVPL